MNNDLLMRSEDLCVYFPGKNRRSGTVHAVEHVSLDIYRGETLGIVGESGCGKSTMLKLMLGMETPQEGTISYDGKPIQTLNLKSLRKRIGSVFQFSKVFPGTIASNVIFGANRKVSDEELSERRKAWKPRKPKITDGYLARYAALVTSGNRGAVLRVPGEEDQ